MVLKMTEESKFYFNKHYLRLTIIFLLIEVLIGAFIHDFILRPFGGDALVVILIYCFVKSFFDSNYLKVSFGVIMFCYLIEVLQYFDYVRYLGLDCSPFFSTLMGRTFSWMDLLAYSAGYMAILLVEYQRRCSWIEI